MLRISDKRALKKLFFGKLGVIVLLVLFVLVAKGTWGVYKKASFAQENKERAVQELETLYEHEVMLTKELERLGTRRGLEEEVRHKFDVGREGETLIVLVDTPESEKEPVPPETSFWEKVVTIFGFK